MTKSDRKPYTNMRRNKRGHVIRNLLLVIIFCMMLNGCMPQKETVASMGNTSTIETINQSEKDSKQANGPGISSRTTVQEYNAGDNNNKTLSPLEMLQGMLKPRYDKLLPPNYNHRKPLNIKLDLRYRQLLELDEKNQILKSMIWFRQYWRDEHITWDPDLYGGIRETRILSEKIWRPDITVYEEVGEREFTPRMPFVKVNWRGYITYSEPVIFETSCALNTAFFPFNSQLCTLTFVSWSQPVTKIDLRAKRDSAELNHESISLFLDSGEWVLQKFGVKKQISYYEGFADVSEFAIKNRNEQAQIIDVPATQITTRKHLRRNSTNEMYSELRYSLVIRRNSSLYMQSMLFPSILLTSVALLGFYLPPDSGERVGLQITILLTFMVFLLTVGDMFPASTGPYLGIYFVICMGQLGVNMFMTVVVLHLHFKPCIRNKEEWHKERASGVERNESLIPVKLRRFLQFCNKYFDLSEEGVAWMMPIKKSTPKNEKQDEVESNLEEEKEHQYEYELSDASISEHTERRTSSSEEELEDDIVLEEVTVNDPPEEKIKNHTQDAFENVSQEKLDYHRTPQDALRNSEKLTGRRKTLPNLMSTAVTKIGKTATKLKSTVRKKSEDITKNKVIENFQNDVRDIFKSVIRKGEKEQDSDDEMEEEIEKEQEEWKSVARAVDRLFFRLYIFIVIGSFAILALVAIVKNFSIQWDI